MKLSPNLIVDSIEACLPFWIARLGFEKTVEVPHEGSLGFVILVRDGAEVMLQRADLPAEHRLRDVQVIGGDASRVSQSLK